MVREFVVAYRSDCKEMSTKLLKSCEFKEISMANDARNGVLLDLFGGVQPGLDAVANANGAPSITFAVIPLWSRIAL